MQCHTTFSDEILPHNFLGCDTSHFTEPESWNPTGKTRALFSQIRPTERPSPMAALTWPTVA